MSLALRLLARRFGAPAGFSATLEPDVFVRLAKYREQALPDCPDDGDVVAVFRRPESPETMCTVAELLAARCSAVCLDVDWARRSTERPTLDRGARPWKDTLKAVSLLRAQAALPVHCVISAEVTADDASDRARDLVDAGCQALVVNTDSWSVAASVCAAVEGTPVIVGDSNISTASDAAACVRFTKAHGVSTARGLLANPALFSAAPVHICDVARDYLAICQQNLSSNVVANVRGHLAHMWHRVLPVAPHVAHLLSNAHSLRDYDTAVTQMSITLDTLVARGCAGAGTAHDLRFCQPFYRLNNESWPRPPQFRFPGDQDQNCVQMALATSLCAAGVDWPSSAALFITDSCAEKLNRMTLARARGLARSTAAQKLTAAQELSISSAPPDGAPAAQFPRRAEIQKARLLSSQQPETRALKIAIDMSLEDHMSLKEIRKTTKQLRYVYAVNRQQEQPANLFLTGLKNGGALHASCVAKSPGFDQYLWRRTESLHFEHFDPQQLVYLTPDSPNPLDVLADDKVYVLGALVDEHVIKNFTLDRAQARGIATARLPIAEHLVRENGFRDRHTALAINQVFEALVGVWHGKSWSDALGAAIPKRKGFTG